MKKFDILRYLRRFFALVLAVTMAGTVVVYWYCKNNQTYTASVNIKYLHDGIKDGFAPDGTAMNVDEIYSSKVISQAMESLGLQSGINLVRSHCTVEELIPDDQKALQEALIDKGEESTYFPDEYKVTLVVDGSLGASYARRVLDAIISSYSTIYTEEYVELPLTMNPSSGLLNSGYDYYECVDVLSAMSLVTRQLFRRRCIEEGRCRFTDYKIAEDALFFVSFYRQHLHCVVGIPEKLYRYKLRASGSASQSYHPERLTDNFYLSDAVEAVARDWGLNDDPACRRAVNHSRVLDLQLGIKNVCLGPLSFRQRTAWLRQALRIPAVRAAVRDMPLQDARSRNDRIKLALLKARLCAAVITLSSWNNRR